MGPAHGLKAILCGMLALGAIIAAAHAGRV